MAQLEFPGLQYFKDKENELNAPVESTSTASKPYKVGEFFYYQGRPCQCTVAIAQGDTIVSSGNGANCKFIKFGDVMAAQSEQIDKLNGILYTERNAEYEFVQGGFNRSGGSLTNYYRKYYLITGDYIQPNVKKVIATTDYKVTCMAWDKSSLDFAGFMDGENHFTTTATKAVYFVQSLDFEILRSLYPNYLFRVELAKNETASGTTTIITPDEASAIAFVEYSNSGLRDYYKTEMEKTIKEVRDSISEPSLVFPLFTDAHFASIDNLSTLFNVGIENISYLSNKIPCDFIINLGDSTDGDVDRSITVGRNKYILQKTAETDNDSLYAIGNHDTNYYYTKNDDGVLSSDQYFPSYLSNLRDVVFDNLSTYPLNYYKDFDGIGIRVIVLDANYLARYSFSENVATWLTNTALDTDYTVVLCEHLSSIKEQNWEARSTANNAAVTSALTAFVNNGGTLIQLCGHAHSDYYFSSPWLAITHGCQKLESVDTTTEAFQAITGYQGSIVSPSRTRRTATEDLWSVFVVKPISGVVAQIRFGAGVNRYFHYKPTAVTTTVALTSILSGTLTWTTSDGDVATVSDGTVTAVATGSCQITATDADGNFETWTVSVA